LNKRVLVLGATSGIGRHCVDVALARGLTVRAFARGAADLPSLPGLEAFPGDATLSEDLRRALADIDAVIYTLGIRERMAMLWEPEELFSTSTALLLEEMQQAEVNRLIVVTGFGAGRSRAAMSFLEKTGHNAVLGRVYADKTRQEALIEASTLEWTIARPVILTNRPASGRIQVLDKPESWRNGLVSRADVAQYLVDAAEHGLNMRQDVVLTR